MTRRLFKWKDNTAELVGAWLVEYYQKHLILDITETRLVNFHILNLIFYSVLLLSITIIILFKIRTLPAFETSGSGLPIPCQRIFSEISYHFDCLKKKNESLIATKILWYGMIFSWSRTYEPFFYPADTAGLVDAWPCAPLDDDCLVLLAVTEARSPLLLYLEHSRPHPCPHGLWRTVIYLTARDDSQISFSFFFTRSTAGAQHISIRIKINTELKMLR